MSFEVEQRVWMDDRGLLAQRKRREVVKNK